MCIRDSPAKADKFWFSDPAAQKDAVENSSPDYIQGVLLSEDADGYHIRVAGGELVLAKKLVFKVEKDDMTVDAIVKAEKASAEAQALANKERELQQQIARKERELKAAEASAHKGGAKAVDASLQTAPAPAPAPFDPVLGVADGRGDVLRQTQLAFQETHDRDYL